MLYILIALYILFLIFGALKKSYGNYFLFFFFFLKTLIIQFFFELSFNIIIFFYFILFSILFFSVFSLFKEKTGKIFLFLILSFLGIIGLVDTIYFSYFKDFPSIVQISQINLLPKLSKSILALFQFKMLFLVIDIFILPFYYKSRKQFKFIYCIPFTLLSVLLLFSIHFIHYKKEKEFYVKRFENKYLVEKIGFLGYHFYDFYYNLKKILFKKEIPENVLKDISSILLESKNSVEEETLYKRIFKNYNLIILQEESLAQWPIDKTIFGPNVMPFLNQLKNKSLYFENFLDQTNQGRTSDSEFSILNSLINFSSGSINYLYSSNNFYTLAERAKKKGYNTLFFHPFDSNFWARNLIFPKYGFENLFFKENYLQRDTIGWGLSNFEFYKQTFEKLKKEKKPFFAYLVTLTGHHPFDEISERNEYGNYDQFPKIISNYLKLCRYKDEALNVFVNFLENEGYFKDTVLIYFGDHDPGLFYEDIAKVLQKPCKIKEEYYLLDRVPFLIYSPLFEPKIFDVPSGHIDIAPTIIHLFDFPLDYWNFLGKNLFSTSSEKMLVHPEGVVFSKNYFYAVAKDECYERYTGRVLNSNYCLNLKNEFNKEKEISYWILESNLSRKINMK